MLRIGTHHLEPRRAAYFVVESSLLLMTSLLIMSVAGQLAPRAGAPRVTALLWGLTITATTEVALYLMELHDLRIALGDARRGERLCRALGLAGIASGVLLATGCAARAPAVIAALGGTGLVALALRAGMPQLGGRLGLQPRLFLVSDGGHGARRLVRELTRDGTTQVVGFCGPRTERLSEKILASGAETVVVCADDRRGLPTRELLLCRAAGLEVVDPATLAARLFHRLPVELLRPSDLIFGDGFAQPTWLRVARRCLSLALSTLLLVLTAPLLVLAALAVRFDSPGPSLFRQVRVGKDGRNFEMIKFRTMRVDAEADGTAQWAAASDPRVTRVGRLLRRFRVDELPQLWNVLRGEMELVGPRPERPEFVDRLRRRVPFYDLRHVVPPGITGYAQVCFSYAATVEESVEKLQYDLYYVRHLSLSLDLLVVLLTARVVLSGRGAR